VWFCLLRLRRRDDDEYFSRSKRNTTRRKAAKLLLLPRRREVGRTPPGACNARFERERKKWRRLVLHLTLQQRMRYLRRFVRRVVVRGVRVQLWSVSTRLYRESESVRESERAREVSKHIHIHRDTKFTQSAREDDVTKRRERTSGMNERATCVENEMLRTFMISHSSSETRTLTSFFSPLLGRCVSSFRMLLL